MMGLAQVTDILARWTHNFHLRTLNDVSDLDINSREDIHDVIDACTVYLRSFSLPIVMTVVGTHLTAILASAADLEAQINSMGADKEKILIDFYFDTILSNILGAPTSSEILRREFKSHIWVTLVFRMLCWFLLHDFSEEDIQIVPSELRGSRMPVFIG